jgi:hypothetical protein
MSFSADFLSIQGVIHGTSQTKQLQKPHNFQNEGLHVYLFAVCPHGF